MKTKKNDIIMQNKIFAWIALATGLILLVPLLAMQFDWVIPDPGNPADTGVTWTLGDFIVMGLLIFGSSSLFVLVARATSRKHRLLLGLMFLVAFLWIWAELAVGVFTNWGS